MGRDGVRAPALTYTDADRHAELRAGGRAGLTAAATVPLAGPWLAAWRRELDVGG